MLFNKTLREALTTLFGLINHKEAVLNASFCIRSIRSEKLLNKKKKKEKKVAF